MAMPHHTFQCRNQQCRKSIPLLYPILQGTPGEQIASVAGGFRVVIACPWCGHVSEYLPRDTHIAQGDSTTSQAFYAVEFQCGHRGCGAPVQFYAVEPAGTTAHVILAKVVAGFFHVTCERGHDFIPAAGEYQIEEMKPS